MKHGVSHVMSVKMSVGMVLPGCATSQQAAVSRMQLVQHQDDCLKCPLGRRMHMLLLFVSEVHKDSATELLLLLVLHLFVTATRFCSSRYVLRKHKSVCAC